MKNNSLVKCLIHRAEKQWAYVFFSGKQTSLRSHDGAPLELLPYRFSTRGRILRYFQRYWSKKIACTMLKNLPLITRRGKLYAIAYDAGPLPIKPLAFAFVRACSAGVIIKVKYGGIPGRPIWVIYRLTKVCGTYKITKRIGPKYDYRYYPR